MLSLYDQLNILGRDVVNEIKNRLIQAGKRNTGSLIDSINYQVIENNNGYELKILANDYFEYVNTGRRPGHPVGSGRILPWVKSKGIQFRSKTGKMLSQESVAFVIARSIGKKGIKPYGVRGNELITTNLINSIIKNKQKYIEDGLTVDITKYITEDIFSNK